MKFMGTKILDNEFLTYFQTLKNPPKKIYYKGNLELLKRKKVAIIGSRKMNLYTKKCVEELSSILKNKVCIVSGGALGVDISASKAALPNTIAIFANGLDQIYPKTNQKIIEEIYKYGLALSENEPNYMPKKYDFLLRNRLVIALSDCVIIAQADLNSGSMQSAKLALELKKPLYVLPQRLNESQGTNKLIKDNKAKLIVDFKEFALEFGIKEEKEQDEFLEFCQKGISVEEALAVYGDKVYEYELEGKIDIAGIFIKVIK
ncbi:DNA protecting protein DprA [Campylobacter novaezeelandiae]|nr:DNA protecting protein DprA [Campylobacter novaezeelandiae]